MLKLAADADFNSRILRGLRRRQPKLDIVRVQDALTPAERSDDDKVLDWAAAERRVLLTHDVTTMRSHAEARIGAGLAMPGVFELSQSLPIGQAIERFSYSQSVASRENGKDRYASCLLSRPLRKNSMLLARFQRQSVPFTAVSDAE
ncbi:MAG TPA: DUF5615 family PIN-like protein [Blastocatellia bacterium]|nr:DUF5615 family PIN-like protein [Blastocatellia bacterium]